MIESYGQTCILIIESETSERGVALMARAWLREYLYKQSRSQTRFKSGQRMHVQI